MGMGGCVGGGVGKNTTTLAVGVTTGGGGMAVGNAVWVSARPVCAMAMAVFCMPVMFGCAGAQAVSARMRKARAILVFMISVSYSQVG